MKRALIAAFALAALPVIAGCSRHARTCPTTPIVFDAPIAVRSPVPDYLTAPLDVSMCAREGPTVGDVREQRARACSALGTANDHRVRTRALRSGPP